MTQLKILVGTTTQNAMLLAQAIALDCADLLGAVEILPMDGLNIHVFDAASPAKTLYLICSATTGSGDVPDNAQALYNSLGCEPLYLGHVRYGVMALGDSSYPQTFCFGGKNFDERLQDLGARRIGDLWCHDASSGDAPETTGAAWCRQWLTQEALPALDASGVTA